jgi:hypothetical protein
MIALKKKTRSNLDGSKILDFNLKLKLLSVCEFPVEQQWRMLYQTCAHDFTAHAFHAKCDDVTHTLTVIKTSNGNIFGGFTERTFNPTSANNGFKSDPHAFIFSLVNRDNQAIKLPIHTIGGEKAICCHQEHGPIFGDGDFKISNRDLKKYDCHMGVSKLGNSYKHPTLKYWTGEYSFLAGFEKFTVSEIEIYQLV